MLREIRITRIGNRVFKSGHAAIGDFEAYSGVTTPRPVKRPISASLFPPEHLPLVKNFIPDAQTHNPTQFLDILM